MNGQFLNAAVSIKMAELKHGASPDSVSIAQTGVGFMVSAAKYWRLVRLDSTGRRRVEEIASAKAFFQAQFPDSQRDIPDAAIQRTLMQLLQDEQTHDDADRCLRCYISNQIQHVCLQLEVQFGRQHGFTCNELLAFVLDDVGRSARSRPNSEYCSLATTILQTFDPERSTLNTWVTQLVRRQPELNAFLLQQGVYLISDWAILNDTTPNQLQRIYTEFHLLTTAETQRAIAILQSYHRIYRQDRLNNRQSAKTRQCLPPTTEQLERMAAYLKQQELILSPERIYSQLQTIATLLRQYRIYARGGKLPVASLDQPEMGAVVAEQQSPESDETLEAQSEFIEFYRAQLLDCLDQTMVQVINERATLLQRKKPPTDQSFLTALHLFHCKGQSMSEMATQLGLQAQYQVSRLLKLKELRADIRQRLLSLLSDRILDKAKEYADPERLQSLEQQVQTVLDEQIAATMQQAEAEANIPKDRPLDSLFNRRLCHHLDTLRRTPQ